MIKTKLQIDYENACNAYLQAFVSRHDLEPEPWPWVGNRVGGIAEASDYYVDMETIRVDVDSQCPLDEFGKWYDYCLRAGTIGVVTPNFDSWLRKCPVRTEGELAEMEATRGKIEELEEHLRAMAAGAPPQLLPNDKSLEPKSDNPIAPDIESEFSALVEDFISKNEANMDSICAFTSEFDELLIAKCESVYFGIIADKTKLFIEAMEQYRMESKNTI